MSEITRIHIMKKKVFCLIAALFTFVTGIYAQAEESILTMRLKLSCSKGRGALTVKKSNN